MSENRVRSQRHEPAYMVQIEGGLPGDDLGLQSVVRLLRRRGVSMVLGTLVVFGAVAAITFWMPKTYESTVTFLLENPGNQRTGALDVLERSGQLGEIDTELGLIEGRAVAESVADVHDLHVKVIRGQESTRGRDVFQSFEAGRDVEPGTYSFEPGRGGDVAVMNELDSVLVRGEPGQPVSFAGIRLNLPSVSQSVGLEVEVVPFGAAVERLQRNVRAATTGRNAEFVEMTCKGPDAEEIPKICDGLADSYLGLRQTLQHNEAEATAGLIREQVASVGLQLRAAEDSLGDYSRRFGAIAVEQEAQEGVRQFVQLTGERLALQAEQEALTSLLQSIEQGDADSGRYRRLASFPTFIRTDRSVMAELMQSLVALDNERSKLLLSRSDDNIDVQNLESRIGDIELQILGIARSYEAALLAQIQSLSDATDVSRAGLTSIPERQVEVARLERRIGLLEDTYRFLQTRLQEAEVAEAVRLPVVRIVDRASVPFEPASPNVPLNLGVGLLLGLAFGGALALFREDTDTSVREKDDLEEMAGVPVLGLLPDMRKPGPVLAVSAEGIGDSWDRYTNGEKPARTKSQQLALEAFRSVVTDLRFRNGGDGDRHQALAVTSATRGDGKTFTTCNLAIAHASVGVNTLLIDADVRAKGVAQFFDIPPRSLGLTEVLAGQVRLEEALRPMTVEYRTGLTILPSGMLIDRAAELFSMPSFAAMIEALKDYYDLILIDTPPLNVLTDAAEVAVAVDGVVLVARQGVTDKKAIRYTLDRLERVDVPVIGMVMNGTKLPHYYRSYSYVYPT